MPARTFHRKAVHALALSAALAAAAAAPPFALAATPKADSAAVVNSSLTAPLFYQLLIGELELRQGAPGAAFDVLLDAARKTKEEQLFRRAADIALQARAGDQALAAARAWREALPGSIDAHRYLVQILVALNRPAETAEPLRSLLALTPAAERPALIAVLPRFFTRATDTRAAAGVVEEVLAEPMKAEPTRVAATVAAGRAWLAAADKARALQLAQRAAAFDPKAEGPALLALEMLPAEPAAEAIVGNYLQAVPQGDAIRAVYARVLAAMQRYPDAAAQLETVTRRSPAAPGPWLSLGALRLELKEPKAATEALRTYVRLAQAAPAAQRGAVPAAAAVEGEADNDDDDNDASTPNAGLVQAYLMLAQAAEQQADFPAAESWLAKIDSPQRALEVQARRASLLARQGRLDEARELIRKLPEKTPAEARAKLLVEAQLLRDAKRWDDAAAVLAQARAASPDDTDLIYEQAMVAEKQDRLDEMERLLRRVIELKPDHHHAYNALGYSLAERNLRLPEARTLIRKALDLMPGEPFITDSLGWVEYRLGNRDEAVRLLRLAYRSRPDTEIGAHLGEVLWVDGQRDEARRVLREARTRDSGNDVLREVLARLRVDL